MALNDLFELVLDTDNNTLLQQNRFYYIALNANTTAQDLADAFETFVAPAIADILHQNGELVQIAVRNLNNLADVATVPLALQGVRIGDVVRGFYVLAMALSAVSPLIRIGRKAFSPISETDISGNVLSGPYQVFVNAAMAAMDSIIVGGGGGSYGPAMFSPANVSHPFDVISSILNIVYKRMSTQNSRKNF